MENSLINVIIIICIAAIIVSLQDIRVAISLQKTFKYM